MAAVLEKKLPKVLRDQTIGDTLIRGARVEVREDSDGRESAFIILTLSDPPSGQDAWDVEDLWGLRRFVRDTIDQLEGLEPALPWYVAFEPENPELGE